MDNSGLWDLVKVTSGWVLEKRGVEVEVEVELKGVEMGMGCVSLPLSVSY